MLRQHTGFVLVTELAIVDKGTAHEESRRNLSRLQNRRDNTRHFAEAIIESQMKGALRQRMPCVRRVDQPIQPDWCIAASKEFQVVLKSFYVLVSVQMFDVRDLAVADHVIVTNEQRGLEDPIY
jgi:hypothetical protein